MHQELQVHSLSVFELLHDFSWLCKDAYLTDIIGYLNAMNSSW
jgi:hypothetical protein